MEISFQYNRDYTADSIYTFANNINTEHGGTHLSGFKSGLTRTLNKYARESKVVKEKETVPEGADYLEGLVAIFSVKVPDPRFESQTKVKLSNTEVEGVVQQAVNDRLASYLAENPPTAKAICRKAVDARIASEAARKAHVRRFERLAGLPGMQIYPSPLKLLADTFGVKATATPARRARRPASSSSARPASRCATWARRPRRRC